MDHDTLKMIAGNAETIKILTGAIEILTGTVTQQGRRIASLEQRQEGDDCSGVQT